MTGQRQDTPPQPLQDLCGIITEPVTDMHVAALLVCGWLDWPHAVMHNTWPTLQAHLALTSQGLLLRWYQRVNALVLNN
jgi:hypothetical protein